MKLKIAPSEMAGFEYNRLFTAHYSKSFYISARMLPKDRRWATFALYGFCRYADNLIDNPRQRTPEELVWETDYLEQELKLAYRSGESEHPILGPFASVAKQTGIPIEYPIELLEGVKMDLTRQRYRNFDELYLFAYRVAGVVGLMMNYVLGYKDRQAFEYAEKLGIAMQLTNILRDVAEDAEMGRIYLPQDELRQFGVEEQDLMSKRMTPQLRELMKFQVQRAHDYYKQAEPGIPMLATESQFAIYASSKIYRGILYKIEAQDYNPFNGRVFVSQAKKVGILVQEIFRTRARVLKEKFSGESKVQLQG
ncbi:MAG: phytoene/squalene synthase family protein [Calditrichia bacterium]